MKNDQNQGLNLPPQANSGALPGNPMPETAAVHLGAVAAKPEPLAYDIIAGSRQAQCQYQNHPPVASAGQADLLQSVTKNSHSQGAD